MVDEMGYFQNKNYEVSVTVWARSKLQTVLQI
jgi:hypothetical protein